MPEKLSIADLTYLKEIHGVCIPDIMRLPGYRNFELDEVLKHDSEEEDEGVSEQPSGKSTAMDLTDMTEVRNVIEKAKYSLQSKRKN